MHMELIKRCQNSLLFKISINKDLLNAPITNFDANSTRALIIQYLSINWPDSTKKIHNYVKRCGKLITYQAVHKTVKELIKERILEKQSEGYALTMHWIKTSKTYFSNLERDYCAFQKEGNTI